MISLNRFDWVLHLATIAVCSYFLAQSVTTYLGGVLESMPSTMTSASVKPLPPPVEEEGGEEGGEYQSIVERNVFNSEFSPVAAGETVAGTEAEQASGAGGPAVKTTLDIKVLGTLAVGDGADRRSSATISSKGSKGAEVYYVGDEKSFAPNVKLTRVGSKQIEFLNNGHLEFAELEDFVNAKKTVFAARDEVFGKEAKGEDKAPSKEGEEAPAETGKVVLDQAEVDAALQNLDKLYQDVRIVPNFKAGKAAGMKVLSIKPGSIASKLGIRRGDVLEKINGQELDIKQGMELFSQMKDMKTFSLDIVRGGKSQTVEYEIK